MTLNGELPSLRYSTEFGSFGANYVKVVEDRPLLSSTKMQSKESNFRSMTYGDFLRGSCERIR